MRSSPPDPTGMVGRVFFLKRGGSRTDRTDPPDASLDRRPPARGGGRDGGPRGAQSGRRAFSNLCGRRRRTSLCARSSPTTPFPVNRSAPSATLQRFRASRMCRAKPPPPLFYVGQPSGRSFLFLPFPPGETARKSLHTSFDQPAPAEPLRPIPKLAGEPTTLPVFFFPARHSLFSCAPGLDGRSCVPPSVPRRSFIAKMLESVAGSATAKNHGPSVDEQIMGQPPPSYAKRAWPAIVADRHLPKQAGVLRFPTFCVNETRDFVALR